MVQVKLVDFNPILGTTNPLLFTWEELGLYQHAIPAGNEQDRNQSSLQPGPPADTPQPQSMKEDIDEIRDLESDKADDEHVPETGNLFSSSCEDACEGDKEPGRSGRLLSHLEIRVVTEPNKIQPNMPTYGVPYELIDNSETSPYNDMIEKLRDRQIQESQ